MDLDTLDRYESVFRKAVKEDFAFQDISLKKVLFISDKPPEKAELVYKRVQKFLEILPEHNQMEWTLISGEDFNTVSELLQRCENEKPDLIVTFRHLKSSPKNLRFSLGVYLDMLTQATTFPVMVLPYYEDKSMYTKVMNETKEVTVVADHIVDDHILLNFGIYFTEKNGKLFITNIEDNATYERYMQVISKVPDLSTDIAREKIVQQLLAEPMSYIESCVKLVRKNNMPLEIVPVVKLGHAIEDYKNQILKHNVDLLIMHTRDGSQLAMHGMAYSLTVEFTHIPLLLI